MIAPRIFCIPALAAPAVAVVRRGPSGWSALGRWDVDAMTYSTGAWLRGALYPQRCDLSPNGRWFAYFALHPAAEWPLGVTYVAISRLPWLTALAAWRTAVTWTRGVQFADDARTWEVDDPDHGDLAPLRGLVGLAVTRPASFAVERRRGWSEGQGMPPRAADDLWDQRREVRVAKPQPGSDGRVCLETRGRYAAFRSGEPSASGYRVVTHGGDHPLGDVQWADWSREGRLLVATASGRLEVRPDGRWTGPGELVADLATERPAPAPPPPEAREF